MAGPFANERKSTQKIIILPDLKLMFFFHWQMDQPFAVQNLNFEQKRGSQFCLPDLLKSFPLVINIS